jgi:hypothetical protein
MSDIFISYASADRERARLLADALANRGYSVWWDRTIPPGRVFDEVIQEAIQSARCMIVLWSTASVRSNWVKTEASEGAARGMLVPALINEVAPPIEFKRIQSANLAQWTGDEAHAEYRNLLDSVERLMKQAPGTGRVSADVVREHKPAANSTPSRMGVAKTFGLGAVFSMLLMGAFWLYSQFGKAPGVPSTMANAPAPAAGGASTPAGANAPPAAAGPAASAKPAPRGRVNLLSAEQGGQVLVASSDQWKVLINGNQEDYVWTDTGFGVFAFRDGRTALIDTFTLLIPKQADVNVKDFELFVGNASPTGPFESIGRFSTQNMRMMQNPYQEFRFPAVKAKYLKFQTLRSHSDAATMYAHEIQVFGELQ